MGEQFQCRFCLESYKEVLAFLDHFETHMNSEKEDQNHEKEMTKMQLLVNETNSKMKEQTQCKSCDKTFSSKRYLKLHITAYKAE